MGNSNQTLKSEPLLYNIRVSHPHFNSLLLGALQPISHLPPYFSHTPLFYLYLVTNKIAILYVNGTICDKLFIHSCTN
ncbi:hypothetical protein PVAP13_8KG334706 [Panicum virgatum]|uniref:Uncharacterized protein n=1 Tax=Panicum virgatum TaxID=38727 RepID=A0A8T0PNW8_PANVG|nr:hypothetical protein PVAP13_8KG334706 [Panicum virgatum]